MIELPVSHKLRALPGPWRRLLAGRAPERDAVLGLRRIYILPTRHGVLFAVLLLVMLLGSINYNNSLGYAFTFLLGSVGLVSILHTYRNLAGLRLTPGKAQPVFAGQEAQFPIHLHNGAKAKRCMIGLQWECGARVRIDILPGTTATASLGVPTWARGLTSLGRFTVFSEYPLGLFRAWAWVNLDANCLVYPRPGKTGLLTQSGQSLDGNRGRSDEGEDFTGLRKYYLGDNLRRVAWKAAARGQGLLTKQFESPVQETLWLSWDALPGIDPEERLARLCRSVLDAVAADQCYGLRLPGKTIAPASGEPHRRACLAALALFKTGAAGIVGTNRSGNRRIAAPHANRLAGSLSPSGGTAAHD